MLSVEALHEKFAPIVPAVPVRLVGTAGGAAARGQDVGAERSREAERLAGADRVDGENIPFAGRRLRQPSLAYCDRLAGGCGHTGDGQRVSDETVLLLRRRSDRNNMDIDVVQGQGN